MKLNKPLLTKINIVLLVIFLFSGITMLYTSIILSKDSIVSISKSSLYSYIKDSTVLKSFLEDKLISLEALDYISKDECDNVTIKMIDNIYNNESIILSDIDIRLIIKESILRYETTINADIYTNIEDDLLEVSNTIIKSINRENADRILVIYDFSSYFYIPLFLSIVIAGLIIYFEKENSIMIIGAIMTLSSLLMYYFFEEVPRILSNNLELLELLGFNKNISKIDVSTNICSIILILGLLLVLVFIGKKSFHAFRRLRTSYLDKYY